MRRKATDDVMFGAYRFVAILYDAFIRLLGLPIGGEKAWRLTFLGMIEPGADEAILDLCCGTGSLTLMLAEKAGNGSNVHGIDLSPDQVKVAAAKARRRGLAAGFSVRDASDTGYPGASFDKVVISGALAEIRKEKRGEIYREARRCLVPHGRLYITEPVRPARGWAALYFRALSIILFPTRPISRELESGGLERELEEAGFVLEERKLSNRGIIRNLKLRAFAG